MNKVVVRAFLMLGGAAVAVAAAAAVAPVSFPAASSVVASDAGPNVVPK